MSQPNIPRDKRFVATATENDSGPYTIIDGWRMNFKYGYATRGNTFKYLIYDTRGSWHLRPYRKPRRKPATVVPVSRVED